MRNETQFTPGLACGQDGGLVYLRRAWRPRRSAHLEKATLFIVDDDPVMRALLELTLQPVGLPCASFDSAQAFLASFDPRLPGCLVCDVRMPGMDGLALQRELNLRGATLPVIFLTAHAEVPIAVTAMRAGAHDFLQKPFQAEDLIVKVRAALELDRKARTSRASADAIRERLCSLTARQRDVLELLVRGWSNKAIAAHLTVALRTVELHRANLMTRMGAASLAELVRMVEDLKHLGASSRS